MILKLFADMPYVEAICENMWTLMGPFLRTFHEEVPVRRLTADNHLHFRFHRGAAGRRSGGGKPGDAGGCGLERTS
jgi:hypothetical protein